VANRELQDFVYSASHDLRSPLRALDGFSEVLLEDCSDVLGEKHLGYLRRIRAASQHMAELIDALLALSRVGRREVELRMTDLSAAAQGIADELAEAEPDRSVSVAVAPGLQARTDEALAEIVLRNLLGNAWKFTSKKDTASIEVGSLRDHGRLVYYVRDDGAGFDQEHAGAMFRPFHRLHGQDEFPGTGIGLATVQRALDKLDGACWAEGEPAREPPSTSPWADPRSLPLGPNAARRLAVSSREEACPRSRHDVESHRTTFWRMHGPPRPRPLPVPGRPTARTRRARRRTGDRASRRLAVAGGVQRPDHLPRRPAK
jgi:signal transduction histidine kinase